MAPMHRARTGTLAIVSLRQVFVLGVFISICGSVYLPEDGPPLSLVDGAPTSGLPRTPTDDGVMTVIPGKVKPPPSERLPGVPAQPPLTCVDQLFVRSKRATHLQVTETEDAVITDIVHTKPVPVRQVIRQPSQTPKFVCPEEWRGLDLTDPNVLECPENATGFFSFPPDCRKYLNCWRGRGTIQPCAPATFFDPVRRECDYPEKVRCLPDCYATGKSGEPGHAADSGSGLNFDNVDGGNGNNYNNQDGIGNGIGDNDTGNDNGQAPTGNEGFGARNPGNSRRPGGYLDLSQNNQGTVINDYGVDPSLYLNPNDPSGHSPLLDVRDLPRGKVSRARPNAGTQQPPKHGPQSDRTSQGEQHSRSRRYVYSSTPSKYCQMEGGSGLAPDPENCGRFYNCANGRGYLMDCAEGTLYSEHQGRCDHSHLVRCGSRPRNGQVPTPYQNPSAPYSPSDSRNAGSIRHEVQVPYHRPNYPSSPLPSGKSIPNYQQTPVRNPDAAYRPAYPSSPVPSQMPQPVFFRPHLQPQHPNYQRPNQDPYNQEYHNNHHHHHHHRHQEGQESTTSTTPPNYHNRYDHPPNTPFIHNHPTNAPFIHNHPPHTPFIHNHPPNTPFQHNHPPYTNNPQNRPNYSPQNPAQSNPPFHTALNPAHNHPSNPQKGSHTPVLREQNPKPASAKDEDTGDQSPQGSSPVGDRRPTQNFYGNNPPPRGTETRNQDPKKPENNPSLYPVRPQGREDRWTIPSETGESTTPPCPTIDEPVEGEADRYTWISLVNKTRSARTPMAGQWIRLRGGRSSSDGFVEILGPGAVWGGVCDADGAWTIDKASIVCKQLGFERGAEAAWQGGPASNKPTHVDSITCGEGAPTLLHCALQRGWNEYACDASTRAINVRCLPNWSSKCQPGETLRGGHCYRLFRPSVEMVDLAHSASEAVEHCRSRGGHIVDINSQAENDFLTDWMATEHPDVDTILTSGLGVRVKDSAARDLWIWQTDNYSPMGYSKWWPGWSNGSGSPPNVGDKTLCVLLKKSYPCDGRRFGEPCSADYMYWYAVDCSQRGQIYPYVCERKADDIGCVDGTSGEYKGSANVTASGRACLPWDDPRVLSGLRYRISEQSRRETLAGHNYCRKVTGNREPWCYVDYGHNIEIRAEDCQIPPCWDRGTTNNDTTYRADTDTDDANNLRQSNNQSSPDAIPPWQYAPNFPHMVFAARVYPDEYEENTVETDQGVAASDIVTTGEEPYETVDPNSVRPSSGRDIDRLVSTTSKPRVAPDPIVAPRPPWSRPRQNSPGRFTTTPAPTELPDQEVVIPDMSQTDRRVLSTTLKPDLSVTNVYSPRPTWSRPRPYRPERSTTTPPPTKQPDQQVANPNMSSFDEIFTNGSPEQSLDQYPYGNELGNPGIQTVGQIPSPSRTPKAPHITQNPQYPQVRQYPQYNPNQQNPQNPQHTQTNNPNPERPENPPKSNLPEIPLDVDDPIPDQLVDNPVMPPYYPDGRPSIPSDEKPPIASRGGFPGTSNDPVQGYNQPSEDTVQRGITPFNELLRILHERYGMPNPPPPQSYNGHTGPMGWYSPLMDSPVRMPRSSPENESTAPQNSFLRLVANETENIMKIPHRKSNEKEDDVPRFFM